MQKLGHVNINALHHVRNSGEAGVESVQHLLLAQLAVGNVVVQFFVRLANRRAVGGIDHRQIEIEQLAQRRHIVNQAAALFRYDRCPGPQHQVSGKECLFLFEVVTQVVFGMARRMDRVQGGSVGLDGRPVFDIGQRKIIRLVFFRPAMF